MITLEDLRARAKAKVAADASAKLLKQAKTAPNASPAAVAAATQALFEATWLPVALVYRWEHWQCRCGKAGENPQGLFTAFHHRQHKGSQLFRLARADEQGLRLPRRWYREHRAVDVCPSCTAGEFALEYVPPVPDTISPLAVPAAFRGEYVKEWERLTEPSPEPEEDDEPDDPSTELDLSDLDEGN